MAETERKALALVNEVAAERGTEYPCVDRRNDARWEALCRAIEQHEAFRQEVSDAVEGVVNSTYMPAPSEHKLARFIIAKPDPLAECLLELDLSTDGKEARHDAEWLVKTIEKRGGKIVWGEG